jgi:hypothetical protein
MIFEIQYKEIIALSILFTSLAYYLDIHRRKRVNVYIVSHLVAIAVSLLISKLIYAAMNSV